MSTAPRSTRALTAIATLQILHSRRAPPENEKAHVMHGGRQATAAAAPKTGGSRRKTVDEENEVHPLAGRGTWMELPDHLLAKPEPQVGAVRECARDRYFHPAPRGRKRHFLLTTLPGRTTSARCTAHTPCGGGPSGSRLFGPSSQKVLSIVTLHCKIARALNFENFK